MYTAERYRVTILTFESEKVFDNPFLDCIVRAEFTGPSGQKIVREAYWDGGNIYRISFAPVETGLWTYVVNAPAETGFHGARGQVECVPYTGALEIYRHGFLKISEDKRYFTYGDGTPFFWLGDTHWEFSYREKWDESNHPAFDSMFKGMVDRRVKQGYTVYQTNLRSDTFIGGTPITGKAPACPM